MPLPTSWLRCKPFYTHRNSVVFLRSLYQCVTVASWLFLTIIIVGQPSRGQGLEDGKSNTDATNQESDEVRSKRIAAERFLQVVLNRPREGTALSKLIQWHEQHQSVDQLRTDLMSRFEKSEDAKSLLLVGLLDLQLGQASDALPALTKAEELLESDAMASYYTAMAYVRSGNTDLAIDALRRALNRKPPAADQILIAKELGKLLTRAGKSAEAEEVWQLLETKFTGDKQIRREIAEISRQEGDFASAIARYEKLAEQESGLAKVELELLAVRQKILLSRSEEALQQLRQLLPRVKPDSWLQGEMFDEIEKLYSQNDDLDGLISFYKDASTDLSTKLRLARVYQAHNRINEAEQLLQRTIEQAPTNIDVHLVYVDVLQQQGEIHRAADVLKKLHELVPQNDDVIMRWGNLVAQDSERSESERAKEAIEIWHRLLNNHPDNPLTFVQVAELLHTLDRNDEAIELYRKAIQIADDPSTFHEYLAEFYWRNKRRAEALAAWHEIVKAERATRDNYVRLTNLLANNGLHAEALAAMREVCEREPLFEHRLSYIDMLCQAGRFPDAQQALNAARKLARSDSEREALWPNQIRIYKETEQLGKQIDEWLAKAKSLQTDADAWLGVALMSERFSSWQQASTALEKYLSLRPDSNSALELSMRLAIHQKDTARAKSVLQKLIALDAQKRIVFIKELANLQLQLGEYEQAIQTARQLQSSDYATELSFFTEVCIQAQQPDLAFPVTQRMTLLHPQDATNYLNLGKILAAQGKQPEAIKAHWQAFELSPENQLANVLQPLSDLYSTSTYPELINQFFDSLQRKRRLGKIDFKNEAELPIQLAKILRESKLILEAINHRYANADLAYWKHGLKCAVQNQILPIAFSFQSHINKISPSPEGEEFLYSLTLRTGHSFTPAEIEQLGPNGERLLFNWLTNNEEDQNYGTVVGAKTAVEITDAVAASILKRFSGDVVILTLTLMNVEGRGSRSTETQLAQAIINGNTWSTYHNQQATHFQSISRSAESSFVSLGYRRFCRQHNYLNETLIKRATIQSAAVNRSAASRPRLYFANSPLDSIEEAKRYAYLILNYDLLAPSQINYTQIDNLCQQALTYNDVAKLSQALWLLDAFEQDLKSPWMKRFDDLYLQTCQALAALGQSTEFNEFDHWVDIRSRMHETKTVAPASRSTLERYLAIWSSIKFKIKPAYLGMLLNELALADLDDEFDRLLDRFVGVNPTQRHVSELLTMLDANNKRTRMLSLPVYRLTLATNSHSAEIAQVFVKQLEDASKSERLTLLKDIIAAHVSFVMSNDPENAFYPIGTTELAKPIPSFLVSSSLLSVTQTLSQDLSKVEAEELLLKWREMADDQSQLPRAAVYQMLLACWAMQTGDFESAAQRLQNINDRLPGRVLFQITLAQTLLELKRYQEALAIIDSLTPDSLTPDLPVNRIVCELIAFEAASKLRDVERIRQVGKTLLGLKLSNAEELKLARGLAEIGERESCELVLRRLYTRGEPAELLEGLQLFASLNSDDPTLTELAKKIIRLTQPSKEYAKLAKPMPSQTLRWPKETNDQARELAFRTLLKLGTLDKLIARNEAQLNSVPCFLELIEAYEVAGRPDTAQLYRAKLLLLQKNK